MPSRSNRRSSSSTCPSSSRSTFANLNSSRTGGRVASTGAVFFWPRAAGGIAVNAMQTTHSVATVREFSGKKNRRIVVLTPLGGWGVATDSLSEFNGQVERFLAKIWGSGRCPRIGVRKADEITLAPRGGFAKREVHAPKQSERVKHAAYVACFTRSKSVGDRTTHSASLHV